MHAELLWSDFRLRMKVSKREILVLRRGGFDLERRHSFNGHYPGQPG